MKNYNDIKLNSKIVYQRKISEQDIIKYAELTGDKNPIHVNKEYAQTSYFGDIICHGTFLDGIISTGLAQKLPGPGTILLSLEIKYISPIKIDDILEIMLEIADKNEIKKTIIVAFKVHNQKSELVALGQTKVIMISDLKVMKKKNN